jgi:hypothetical protein
MVEKRKSPRIGSINLSYICLDKEGNVLHQAMGRTLNISEGGFLIEIYYPMQEEYTLMASIGIEDNTIDIKGNIIHCKSSGDGKYIAGVEITSIKDEERSLWVNFIQKMSSDEVPEIDTDI